MVKALDLSKRKRHRILLSTLKTVSVQSTRLNTQELVLDIAKMNCSLQIIGLKLMNNKVI